VDRPRHRRRPRAPSGAPAAAAFARSGRVVRSEDIKRIFCDACDALGVQWRVMNRDSISVARRASVARLDEFIGPKR
jgi:RNase P subunit RPR2